MPDSFYNFMPGITKIFDLKENYLLCNADMNTKHKTKKS